MKTKEQLIKVFEEVIEDIISREYEYKDNYIEFPETVSVELQSPSLEGLFIPLLL